MKVLARFLEGLTEDLVGHFEGEPAEVGLGEGREAHAIYEILEVHGHRLEGLLGVLTVGLALALLLEELLKVRLGELLLCSLRELCILVLVVLLVGLSEGSSKCGLGTIVVSSLLRIRQYGIGFRDLGEHLGGCLTIVWVFVLNRSEVRTGWYWRAKVR